MSYAVRAIIKCEFNVYVDDEKDEKSTAQIIEEARQNIMDGQGELVDEVDIQEEDILGIWIDHSVPD